jgi:acyl-CoA thioester hydrolase
MKTYYEGPVVAAEIDNLGHMNVRVYARKAAQATFTLAEAVGLAPARLAAEGAVVQIMDGHIRFYREQLEGAPLLIRGGGRWIGDERIGIYLEMINADSGDVAATFNNSFGLFDATSRTPRAMPRDVLDAARALIIDWPERGQPRSLPLDDITPPSLAGMEDNTSFVRFDGYAVSPEEADRYGYMDISDAKSIALARLPIKFKAQHRGYQPEDGRRIAIATIESRQVMFSVPRLGDPVITRTKHVDVGRKSVTFEHWSFNEATGAPISVLKQLGLGFDLEARRTAEFPEAMRASLAGNGRPDLADDR